MKLLKQVTLVGALMVATLLLASVSEVQASRHCGGARMHVRQAKAYQFTGHHHAQYVVPPNRYRKHIINNAPYHYGCFR